MGNPLFGIDISGLIKDNVAPGVLEVTLTKFAPGTRTPGQLTGGTNPTSTTYACRGFIDSQSRTYLKGSRTQTSSVVVVLIGDTISGGSVAPSDGDLVTIEGTTYVINDIDRDPAAATYTLMCNRV